MKKDYSFNNYNTKKDNFNQLSINNTKQNNSSFVSAVSKKYTENILPQKNSSLISNNKFNSHYIKKDNKTTILKNSTISYKSISINKINNILSKKTNKNTRLSAEISPISKNISQKLNKVKNFNESINKTNNNTDNSNNFKIQNFYTKSENKYPNLQVKLKKVSFSNIGKNPNNIGAEIDNSFQDYPDGKNINKNSINNYNNKDLKITNFDQNKENYNLKKNEKNLFKEILNKKNLVKNENYQSNSKIYNIPTSNFNSLSNDNILLVKDISNYGNRSNSYDIYFELDKLKTRTKFILEKYNNSFIEISDLKNDKFLSENKKILNNKKDNYIYNISK